MRVNKYVAQALGIGRRQADKLINTGEVLINDSPATAGSLVEAGDTVSYNGEVISPTDTTTTIALHKPVDYVCSRNGQGSKTIYDLLPKEYQLLNPAGRLDKNTSGILIMTTDGSLIETLTHPRYEKAKRYEVSLNRPLKPVHLQKLLSGVKLEDGMSSFDAVTGQGKDLAVTLHEGRNRQIRRTFAQLGYSVIRLHRTDFGPYTLGNIQPGKFQII